MITPHEQAPGQEPIVFEWVKKALAKMDMESVRGFYGRLRGALAGAGITPEYLADVAHEEHLFNFAHMKGMVFIDLPQEGTEDKNTLRLIRITPLNERGSRLEEVFILDAEGNASYNATNFAINDEGERISEGLFGIISPHKQDEPKMVIDKLQDLTDNLEKSLASPVYLPQNIKYQIAALYGRLIQHLIPEGITRTGEQKESINYNNVALPGLGRVTLNFIREEGINGLRLTQRRPDGKIVHFVLYDTGNAELLAFPQNGNGDPVSYGRIKINWHGDRNEDILNPYLIYREFQPAINALAPKTPRGVTSS